jgi:Fe-S oxidoreductase
VAYLAENPEVAAKAAERRKAMEGAEKDESKHGLEYAEEMGDELPELSAHASDLSAGEVADIVDHCFQCKLCYINCPYTPSDNHAFALDFPRLLLRYKAIEAKKNGIPFFKRLMTNTDRLGKIASKIAPLMNAANTNALNRFLMEKTAGIHRKKLLPSFSGQTFAAWWAGRHHGPTSPSPATPVTPVVSPENPDEGAATPPVPKRVALFSTCMVNYNSPAIGRAATKVMVHNGVEVAWPQEQVCCGMPFCDSGDMKSAVANLRKNVELLHPYVEQGYLVVTLEPSCGLMLRQEYVQLSEGGDAELERKAKAVAAATRDVHEYLFELKREKTLNREFAKKHGAVKYHVPCHLRAQNIGFRSRDVLKMCSDSVELIQECSAHDGTWSMDKRYFEESQKYGRKLFDAVTKDGCESACTDCSLSATQIFQGTETKAKHPIEMVADAYGLEY